jgi:hypothetical protein
VRHFVSRFLQLAGLLDPADKNSLKLLNATMTELNRLPWPCRKVAHRNPQLRRAAGGGPILAAEPCGQLSSQPLSSFETDAVGRIMPRSPHGTSASSLRSSSAPVRPARESEKSLSPPVVSPTNVSSARPKDFNNLTEAPPVPASLWRGK